MPFTISHTAAILPIHHWSKARLPLAALAIGSMSPDVAYFLPFQLGSESHSLAGIVYFCWPAGFVLWSIFEYVLKTPTRELMPETLRSRLAAQRNPMSTQLFVRVAIAVMLGALTHVVWDSFTHATTPIVKSLDILRTHLFYIGDESIRLYRVLQHLSTLFGAAVLLIAALSWWKRSGIIPELETAGAGLTPRQKTLAFSMICMTSLVCATLYYILNTDVVFTRKLVYLCIGGMTGFVLGWTGVSVCVMCKGRNSLYGMRPSG